MRPIYRKFLLLSTMAIAMFSCSKTEEGYRDNEDLKKAMLSRAQLLIQSSATKASSPEDSVSYFTFDPGSLDPDWESAEYVWNENRGTDNLEFMAETDLQYYFERDSSLFACTKEFLYVHNAERGEDGLFTAYYIPSELYMSSHGTNIPLYNSNSGHNEGYDGIKIYTGMDGCVIRIDEYSEGNLLRGIFLPSLETQEEITNSVSIIRDMLSDVKISRSMYSAATKAGDGGDKGYITGIGAGYSLCVAYVDDFYLEEWVRWQNESERRGGGSGSGSTTMDPGARSSGGGGGTSNSAAANGEDWRIPKAKKESYITYFKNTLSEVESHKEDISIIGKVFDALDNTSLEISISIDDVYYHCTSAKKVKEQSGVLVGYVIHIPPHLLDSNIAIFEELFHIYQRIQDPSWQNGDLEFEAKVLAEQLSGIWFDQGIINDNNSPFDNYYNDPTAATYNDAMDHYLREYAYPFTDYPITPGLSPEDRIKHIK